MLVKASVAVGTVGVSMIGDGVLRWQEDRKMNRINNAESIASWRCLLMIHLSFRSCDQQEGFLGFALIICAVREGHHCL